MLVSLAILPSLLFATPSLAQNDRGQDEPWVDQEPDFELQFITGARFEHQFKSEIDDGGSMTVSRFNAGLSVGAPITDSLSINGLLRYEFDYYRFRGSSGAFGGDSPWRNVHTVSFGAVLNADMTNDWRIFGGPIFQFSGESSARASDSFIGGGIIGTSFDFSDDLTIGGGVGIVSQIEDSVRVFPVIVLNWQITEELRLSSQAARSASDFGGLELIYQFHPQWEAAFGGAYRFRRFRLDSSDTDASRGVGQDSYLPLWGRITYYFSPQASVSAFGGASLNGRLELEDRDGNRLAREDYDNASFVGVALNVRF
ncbi:MAG: hypothetical protein EA377_04605 [Phycisphaerales bacterium]|nr:MAG: hypothetical protein EA377_04605 [Phycisphaerales bacterium]